ncbi:MAG: restriction endonuclease, partial [Caldilineales bacterium]|nr:restriction endonuclease [Caldilineales bacterium]
MSGARWAVELKWQNKAVGEKELKLLVVKARLLNALPWCISRNGFTPTARAYAEANNILISARSDLEKIERAVRSD